MNGVVGLIFIVGLCALIIYEVVNIVKAIKRKRRKKRNAMRSDAPQEIEVELKSPDLDDDEVKHSRDE